MRTGRVKRKTKETDIEVRINLDGSGKADVGTGIKFFDHLLSSFARHGCIDVKAKAKGDQDDPRH